MNRTWKWLIASFALLGGLAGTPAAAQAADATLSGVVRDTSDVPIAGALVSVSAAGELATLSEKDLRNRVASNIEDVAANVPNFAVQNLGPGQSQISMRGVSSGQIARDQPGVKEQVGVYLDESPISLSLFTPDLDLFDMNRVETLRGPQGTLFGSGSVGGTIRYITNQPKLGKLEGLAEANINHVADGD